MEGMPLRTSQAKRRAEATRGRANSVMNTAEPTPRGMPARVARPTTTSEPVMALRRPPPASPVGQGQGG